MGKNKMISQTVGLSFMLLSIPSIQFVLDGLGMVFIWVSVVLGYWSAMDYFVNFYKEAKRRAHEGD